MTFFDLPKNFIDKSVCISFKGVEQGFSLFLNGHYVGYSEDTFTPSDFDLTRYIKEKNNRLCVEVYKKTSSAWVEYQDFFRFSGIFRDVILYAKPKAHIEDLWVLPIVNDDLIDGTLEIKVKLSAKSKISFKLLDGDNEILDVSPTLKTTEDGYFSTCPYDVHNLKLWALKIQIYTN